MRRANPSLCSTRTAFRCTIIWLGDRFQQDLVQHQGPADPHQGQGPRLCPRVSWDNTEFHELHSHFASITHGCLFRNSLAWEEYWRWDEDDTNVAVYYNVKDKPCGYMVYLIKNDIMHIKEMVYLNREAQKGLWEYIHAHDP